MKAEYGGKNFSRKLPCYLAGESFRLQADRVPSGRYYHLGKEGSGITFLELCCDLGVKGRMSPNGKWGLPCPEGQDSIRLSWL